MVRRPAPTTGARVADLPGLVLGARAGVGLSRLRHGRHARAPRRISGPVRMASANRRQPAHGPNPRLLTPQDSTRAYFSHSLIPLCNTHRESARKKVSISSQICSSRWARTSRSRLNSEEYFLRFPMTHLLDHYDLSRCVRFIGVKPIRQSNVG